jgi:hypothetical protein
MVVSGIALFLISFRVPTCGNNASCSNQRSKEGCYADRDILKNLFLLRRQLMEKTGTEMVFKWFEDVWAQGDEALIRPPHDASYAISGGGSSVPISSEEFRRAHRDLKEGMADIRLGFESFASNGDQVTCAMVVKARDKVSGAPMAFRSSFDGRVRGGQLVSASNAIDYFLAE